MLRSTHSVTTPLQESRSAVSESILRFQNWAQETDSYSVSNCTEFSQKEKLCAVGAQRRADGLPPLIVLGSPMACVSARVSKCTQTRGARTGTEETLFHKEQRCANEITIPSRLQTKGFSSHSPPGLFPDGAILSGSLREYWVIL